MKKLDYKLCPHCDSKIYGVKRKDRNSYYYAISCPSCSHKSFDPSVLEKKRSVLNKIRDIYHTKPIGTITLHKSDSKNIYKKIKTEFGWKYEHRVIANTPPGMHTHHLNENTLDNSPNNLVVLTNGMHCSIHNSSYGWSKKFDHCQSCFTTIKKHVALGLCTTCYQKK